MRKFLRNLSCTVIAVGVSIYVFAQDVTVSGKVTSEEGEALPGVNVVLKGTTTGTVTDLEGQYKLTVPENARLVFSSIGFATQEVALNGRTVIDVQLGSDVQQLTEVVVTAVGIQREERALGYSVENVGGEKVQQVAEPDPLRALQGKVAGVNLLSTSGAPGSSTRITIRGNSSLLNDNQPLFVVDGIPYNNDFITTSGTNVNTGGLTAGGAFGSRISDLDPNNIESITVLKGAAAAALYGSRAANGVVVITTKTGSTQLSNKGFEMSYGMTYGIEKIANLPDLQNTYGTGTNFNYAQANGSWGPPFVGTRNYATLDSIPHWYAGRAGWNGLYDNVNVPYQAYPDNVKDFFENGSIFENSLTIRGGNDIAQLTGTVSHMDQNGFVPESEFSRTSISGGGRAELDNGFSVGLSLSYSRSDQAGPISGVGNLGGNNPSAFARTLLLGRNWDLHGQPYQNPTDLGSEFMVGRGTANNPYWSVENSGITTQTDRYVGSFDLGYDITEWLNVTWRAGANGYYSRVTERDRPGSTSTSLGTFTELNVNFLEVNSDVFATITPDIGEDFSLRAIVGHNLNQRTTRTQQVNGTGYVVFDIDDLDNMNSVIPAGGTFQERRLIGAYADINLGYRDWAFLTLTARNDWSSTLPKGNNSFLYPAVTGSVVLTDALNLESDLLSFLKVRAGWAEVGNDTDPYQITPVFLINESLSDNISSTTAQKPFTPTGGSTQAAATLSNIARDPNLRPETTREVETGLEARFFNNRFGIDVTYYNRNTIDQIIQVTVPEETGFVSFFTNSGKVNNEGIEITADIDVFAPGGAFQWNILGTFTHNKNTVVELPEGINLLTFGSFFSGTVRSVHLPGQEFGLLYGSVSARDDEGNLLIDPSNGQLIGALQPEVVGNPNPDFIMGLTNSFSFKGFNLSAVFDWRQGGDIYSNTVQSQLGRGVLAHQADRETMVFIPGVYGDPNTQEPIRDETGAKIPNETMIEVNTLYFGQTFAANSDAEWSVWDGTTFRLREVMIGYSLPSALLESTPFGSVNVSLVGRNLWFLAPYFPKDSNYDPETNQFGARNAQGIEYATTPSARRFAVNLRVTF